MDSSLHANCLVTKPVDLDRCIKVVGSIEAFEAFRLRIVLPLDGTK